MAKLPLNYIVALKASNNCKVCFNTLFCFRQALRARLKIATLPKTVLIDSAKID